MTAERLQDALAKAFRMGACSIHVPDQAERIKVDFAGFVLDEVAAFNASQSPAEGDDKSEWFAMLDALAMDARKLMDCLAVPVGDAKYTLGAALDAMAFKVQPKGTPVAWSRQQFIHDDDGYSIGTDEPELHWGKEPPDDEAGWHPLYAAAGVTTRDAALEEAAQLCELWNTTPGKKLAKEIRALAFQAPAPADENAGGCLCTSKCLSAAPLSMCKGLPSVLAAQAPAVTHDVMQQALEAAKRIHGNVDKLREQCGAETEEEGWAVRAMHDAERIMAALDTGSKP